MKNNIVIIGAGPTGLITSLLLAEQGYKVSLIESNSEDLILEDTKALAISKSTVFILKKLNIWADRISAHKYPQAIPRMPKNPRLQW